MTQERTDRLRRVADEVEIRAALARYCRGVDRRDVDAVMSAFHDDASNDHGGFVGSVAEFIDYMFSVTSRYLSTQLVLGQSVIVVDGDSARSETYITARSLLAEPAADGRRRLDELVGRYLDHWERRAGEWRISSRELIKDWRELRILDDPPEAVAKADHLTAGTLDASDRSFRLFDGPWAVAPPRIGASAS